jgi:hypothetical protein
MYLYTHTHTHTHTDDEWHFPWAIPRRGAHVDAGALFSIFFLNAADFSVSCLGGDVDAGALFQKKNSFISMPLTFSVPCLWADVNASALFFQFFFLFFNADDFCLSFPVSERGSCSFQ